MIVRSWSARTTPRHLPAYLEHLQLRVLPELEGIDGFQGLQVLERRDGDAVEVVVQTHWRSLDAIRQFAGDDLERAVVEDLAARLLTSYDDRCKHYQVPLPRGH